MTFYDSTRTATAEYKQDRRLKARPGHHVLLASNPCSEYMFLDDSACNLSSLNLTKFLGEDGAFDVDGYRHAVRVFFVAQEILVDFSSLPDRAASPRTRTTTARSASATPTSARCSCCSASPTTPTRGARSPARSPRSCAATPTRSRAEMAGTKGAVRRLRQEPRADAARDAACTATRPTRSTATSAPRTLWRAACADWDDAVQLGQEHGYRNAQATVLAPTGTIGLLMDCDTTGIEPDFSLVKFKKLAGGGYFKIVNQSVPEALRRLGYAERRGAGDRRLRVGHEHAARRAPRQPRVAQGSAGSRTRTSPRSRRRSPASSISTSRSVRGCSAKRRTTRLGVAARVARAPRLLAAQAPRLHARARSRRRTRRSSAA